MLFSSGGANTQSEYQLLFYIGSGNVVAGIVELPDNGKPRILYGTTAAIVVPEKLEIKQYLAAIERAFDIAAQELLAKGIPKHRVSPRKAMVTLGSPWYISVTDQIAMESAAPRTANVSIIEPMIRKATENFISSRAVEEHPYQETGVDIIDRRIIEIRLNGYPTSKPYGKISQTIDIALFQSVVSREAHIYATRVLEKTFPHVRVVYNVMPLVAYSVLRTISPATNALIVDIGEEVTDVSIVQQGILKETTTFPAGTHELLRVVAKERGIAVTEALDQLRLYAQDSVLESVSDDLTRAMRAAEANWVSRFEQTLAGLTYAVAIPHTIYLLAPQDLESVYRDFIGREQFGQFSRTAGAFEVAIVTPAMLDSFVTFLDANARNATLALQALYASILQQSEEHPLES